MTGTSVCSSQIAVRQLLGAKDAICFLTAGRRSSYWRGMPRFFIYISFQGLGQKQQWGLLTMLATGLPSPAGRALLTLLTILCKCRLGFGIWSTHGRSAEPGETASAGQSWKGGVAPSRLWWAGKQSTLTGILVNRSLKAAWSLKAIPPSKKAWRGQKGGGEGGWDEGWKPLCSNSVVPLLLFCLSWEKNELPQEKIHFFSVT